MEAVRLYELMNKDVAILAFSVDPVTEKVDELERFGAPLPIGFCEGSYIECIHILYRVLFTAGCYLAQGSFLSSARMNSLPNSF